MRPHHILLTCVCFLPSLQAQLKPPVAADYGQFETLGPAAISPDGKWLAYTVNRSDRSSELRVTNIATGDTKVTAYGSQPAFSSDSRWVAFGIGVSEAQQEKLRKDKKPVHRKLGIIELAKGEQTT